VKSCHFLAKKFRLSIIIGHLRKIFFDLFGSGLSGLWTGNLFFITKEFLPNRPGSDMANRTPEPIFFHHICDPLFFQILFSSESSDDESRSD
jgi:hypothetical protein